MNLMGQPIVVLNSVEVAVDLMEKRGATYSERPDFHFFEELHPFIMVGGREANGAQVRMER